MNRTSRETSPEPQPEHQYQSVIPESGQTRRYQQSNLSASRTNRQQSLSDAAERAARETEKSRVDGTESTLSTTAPSTVWDELDDLKSRIRKLELTGKLPTSSAAAMSHVAAERPRTATTTVTTISSSPKHGRKAASPPPETSENGSASNQIRPLLQSALEKAKPILNKEVYKALEATATDALALSNMLGPSGPQPSGMSVVSGSGNSERQARRKADSMCRSLTELCLALSDEKLISLPNQRPGSRDVSSTRQQGDGTETESNTPTYRRSASHEPEEMRWSQNNRASGQLESRRNSRLSINTGGSRLSQDTNRTIPTPTHATPPNRLSRTSTALRSRRNQGDDDTDERQSFLSRPLSRARTDLGNSNTPQNRFSPRDRNSLQHNQTPEEPSRNPSLAQSAIPLRRNYVSPSTQLPTAPHSNIQPGSRRYGGVSASSTPGQATNNTQYDGPSDESPLQQRTQLRGPSSASRPAGGRLSDVQPLRTRTNSMGTRRFGLRSRQVTMNLDGRDGIGAGNAE
ncbi:hypothetical protein FQN54_003589 [Arachnomyces sp. PD_36]|nr:hypothetical protein FQN54_003589 [Arachnomyces sp. PD_36]